MFEENPEQFNQHLARLRQAASAARQGNSRESEMALQSVAAVPPSVVVQLSLAAMRDVFTSFPPQQQSEVERLGPFLLLVAARLLHGGLSRDWTNYWSTRLTQLRAIRQNLEEHLKNPAIHSGWLSPAVAEVAVAWSILSKQIMIAKDGENTSNNNDNNNNDNNDQQGHPSTPTTIPDAALNFLVEEWCGMLNSVNDNIQTAAVYCSLIRHSIEEFGLTVKVSLGRGGLSLEQHDSLREATFENVLPRTIFTVAQNMLVLGSRIRHNSNQNNNQRNEMVNALSKLTQILHICFCWGPSVYSSDFGVDQTPTFLILPQKKYRQCLFASLDNLPKDILNSNIIPINDKNINNLLLSEALVVAFDVGLHLGNETNLSLPAIQCFVQLCSISMKAGGAAAAAKVLSPHYRTPDNSMSEKDIQEQQSEENMNPPFWTAFEVAQWIDEMFRCLLSVCAFQVFQQYLPNPKLTSGANNNTTKMLSCNNDNDKNALFKVEEQIELGGSLLSAVAQAICRICSNNAIQKEVLTLEPSLEKFPNDVVLPLSKFSENLIRYHHELSVTIRKIFAEDSTAATVGESMQVEEVFTEAIDSMLQCWREIVKVAIEDSECNAALTGTALRNGIVSSSQSIFESFLNSRIRFVQEAKNSSSSSSSSAQNTNNNQQSSSSSSSGQRVDSRGGLVASSIQSRGMEYTLSQITTVGLLGRQEPVVTCNLLSSFLGPHTSNYLQSLTTNPQGPAFSQTESVWYLFQIMAWLLTDDENSTTDIPSQINNIALAIENEAAREGAHRQDDVQFWKEIERRMPTFNLVEGCFYFCNKLIEAVSNAPNDRKQIIISHINPLIITALLAFLRRYAHTYIFEQQQQQQPNRGSSSSASESGSSYVFQIAFDFGKVAASNILRFMNWSICHFYSQEEAMKEVGEVLYALGSKPQIGNWLMSDRERSAIICAAAAGDDSGPFLTSRLSGARRGSIAGALISACGDDSMVQPAMEFLKYYTRGFASPIDPQNFSAIADSVSSVAYLLANARHQHHLGTLVEIAQPYLVSVVDCVTDTPVNQQNVELLASLLEVFMNGIDTCSFSLSTQVISWMLHSSVSIINMVGNVVRFSVEQIVPNLANNSPQKEREEQNQLKLLKASAALILFAAQWGNMNICEFNETGSSDERERVVGELCVNGMLVVLREARHTDLIEVPELSSIVFRLVREVAQTHTKFFLGVDQEHATTLLDATHWALSSADPTLVTCGFSIVEALTLAPDSVNRMPRLLKRFLAICIHAVLKGTAADPEIQQSLSNAVFALGNVLGRDELCDVFAHAVSEHPLLSKDGVGKNNRYVKVFAEAMFQEVNWGNDRKRRRMFAPILRRITMVIKGANIFNFF